MGCVIKSKRLGFGNDPDRDAHPRIFKGIFIALQRAMRAERDIVLPIPSVRPSVRLSVHAMPVLCLNECTYRHTF